MRLLVRLPFGSPFRSRALAAVGDIETASLKEEGGGMYDAAQLALTFGADSQGLFIKVLPLLETEVTEIALVVIDRHLPHLRRYSARYFTGTVSLQAS